MASPRVWLGREAGDIPVIDVTWDTVQLFRLSPAVVQKDGPGIPEKTESKLVMRDTSQEFMGPYVLYTAELQSAPAAWAATTASRNSPVLAKEVWVGLPVGLGVGALVGMGVVGLGVGGSVGQIAQYGPAVTDVGSEVLAHAVPWKVCWKATSDGNRVRQVQRSWLNEVASKNFDIGINTRRSGHEGSFNTWYSSQRAKESLTISRIPLTNEISQASKRPLNDEYLNCVVNRKSEYSSQPVCYQSSAYLYSPCNPC